MNNIFRLLCVSRSPRLKQPRNRKDANRIVFLNVFSEGVQVSPLTSVSLQGKKSSPVFRLDKTSAPSFLTKSGARKWDYCEYPSTGTCSIVILSSTQNKELWFYLALQKNKAPLLTPFLFSLLCPHLHLPFLPPTFLSTPTLHSRPILFPSLLLSLFLPSQIPSPHPFLLIVCWADLGLTCVDLFPSLHPPFRKMAVFAVRGATRHPTAKG